MYNGADNLIAKPYDNAFLLARVEDMLATLQIGTENADKMFALSMDGRKYSVSAERLRIINSIFTVYETAISQNRQLEEANSLIAQQTKQLEAAQRLIQQQKAELERCPWSVNAHEFEELLFIRLNECRFPRK